MDKYCITTVNVETAYLQPKEEIDSTGKVKSFVFQSLWLHSEDMTSPMIKVE